MGADYKLSEKHYNENHKKIEQQCLIITSILNLSLAIVEIIFFFLVKSTSILFDGIFSTVMTLTSISALLLSIFIKKKSFNYPFGKSIYDNIFSLFKSLLLIVLCGYFLIDSALILHQIVNNTYVYEEFANISLYIAYISVACGVSVITFSIYFAYSKKLKHQSIILKAEIKSSIMDFMISFFIGLALLISNLSSNDLFIREVVDKSLTIVLVVIMLPINFKAFIIDLLIICGYRMYKEEEKELINHINEKSIVDIYIQRHNQQKIFMVTINFDGKAKELKKLKIKIEENIYEHYSKDSQIYFLV